MRLRYHSYYSIYRRFNPRICKRCDQFRGFSYKEIIVSIHASVKDATLHSNCRLSKLQVSIHASVKDATTYGDGNTNTIVVSIHASVKDATLY